MSATKIGIQTPHNKADNWIDYNHDEDTDMCYELYEVLVGDDYILGIYSDAVGLVTWWEVDTLAEAEEIMYGG